MSPIEGIDLSCKILQSLIREIQTDQDSIIYQGEMILAEVKRLVGVDCEKCAGYGHLTYGSTAGWKKHGVAGQTLTSDVCDSCWGTGRRDQTGVNLRRLDSLLGAREIGNLPEE